MTGQKRDHVKGTLVDHHHRRIRSLVPDKRGDSSHRDTCGTYIDQRVQLIEVFFCPLMDVLRSAAAGHASSEYLRDLLRQRFPLVGECDESYLRPFLNSLLFFHGSVPFDL